VSSVDLADGLVCRARRRLALCQALEHAATGVLAAGAIAAAIGALLFAGALPGAPSLLLLCLPVAGGVLGGIHGVVRRPDQTFAALAIDRAAGAHEAFVSALTATDASPAMRELAARYGLSAMAGRSLGALLPVSVPSRAAPAAVAVGLTAALVAIGTSPDAAAASRREEAPAASAVVATGGDARGASTSESPTHEPVPVQGSSATNSGSGQTAGGAIRPEELPALPAAEVRQLAEDLAARGVDAGALALEALARGDRDAAEALLRSALAARGDGTGSAPAAIPGSGSNKGSAGAAPGGWSVGAWPLRYDREVRVWLRRQVADDRRVNPKGEQR